MPETPITPSQPSGIPSFEKHAQVPAVVRRSSNPSVIVFLVMIVLGFGMAAGGFAYLAHRSRGAKLVSPPPGAEVAAYKVEVEPTAAPEAVEETVPVPSEKPLPTLKLGGILVSDGGASMALINGKVVREGATIEGARLIKVSTEKVELDFEGRKISIRAL